ncbi:MAG: DNA damage-inducible protein D [Bacilli bacterium]|nr:DNA damage-inducible protein D [Bacilli bacterium]
MKIELYNNKIFEDIKHIDEEGNEYWYARELQKVLEYTEWRKFKGIIDKAIKTCVVSQNNVSYNFVDADKIVNTGVATKKIKDYKLSRYACYLIVMNGDTRKEVIALGQTYFAIQTRKQELIESNYYNLTEDEKRIFNRELTRKGNKALTETAKKAGVVNLDKFHNAGYKGLYNGETANDIAKRKKLRYREDILDNMGSSELIANLFRIDQTNQRMINEDIKGEKNSCQTHYKVGKIVRKAIKDAGGTMPEDLPTPKKSLKELENKKR